MQNRTKFINYIPERFRLFMFYTVMAWWSLFKPEDGRTLINHADSYAIEQQKKEIYKAWRGLRDEQS